MKDSSIETISLEKSINAVILASGRGSNAKALLEYCRTSENLNANIPWDIKLIVTDNHDAGVIQVANDFDIPVIVLPFPKVNKEDRDQRRQKYSTELAAQIKRFDDSITFAICAGFMKIVTVDFLNAFKEPNLNLYRVINIHPSLLPSFPGANAYRDAFEYGVSISGATTHFVDEKVDHGPIIDQSSFKRVGEDTLESFKVRGLEQEYPLFVNTLKLIQNNKLRFINQPDNQRLVINVLRD